jgi:hypothetical protein
MYRFRYVPFGLFFCIFSGGLLAQSEPDSGDAAPPTAVASPYIRPIEADRLPLDIWLAPRRESGVNWGALVGQSTLFLSTQHAFRLATERGTRQGMQGAFFPGYAHAAGNLHGWSDGDPFYVNYIGHPIQGAVAGFIWAQNDNDYLGAQFGRNRLYWKSRLRAAAFSFAYSTQFEIGPFSEASIGKVQSRWPQQGMVDLVVTPVVGTGWMVAEDFLDQYVVKWVERRTDNPYVVLLARGVLNPSRSFANAMRLQVPWIRDDRPHAFSGLTRSYALAEKAGRILPRIPAEPEIEGEFGVSKVEVSMDLRPEKYFGSGGTGLCLGGGGEMAIRLTPDWQLIGQLHGCKLTGLGPNLTGDTLTYLAGPRWTPRPSSRWSPYAHVLLGGMKVTQEEMLPDVKAALESSGAIKPSADLPPHELYTNAYESNGFAFAAGTGVDLRLNPALALRLANIEYKRSWLPPVNGRDYSNGLSFTASMIIRMGTW